MRRATTPTAPPIRFHGSDRDAGAIEMSRANAARAGVAGMTHFEQRPISDLMPPEGAPGLVIVNPPYGDRIGDRWLRRSIARSGRRAISLRRLARRLIPARHGWRVLPRFRSPGAPVANGGLRITLYVTDALA